MALVAITAVLLATVLVSGWGPGHHLEFAERVWRRRRETLPRDVAKLLGEHKMAYAYGNLAADIINMKAYGGHRNHCHRWTICEQMRELADSPREEAFIAGYLSHLAADTIAHNHFVPYHLTRYARTKGLGHLYWEMNADRYVPESRWDVVTILKESPELGELDELINATVPKKALPMGTNKLIFNHVLLISEKKAWRTGVRRIHPIEKVKLTRGFLGLFQKAAVARVRLALRPKGLASLLHIDTTGAAAQKEAVRRRKKLLEMRPGQKRDERSEAAAASFLEGMESPPRRHADATPHW